MTRGGPHAAVEKFVCRVVTIKIGHHSKPKRLKIIGVGGSKSSSASLEAAEMVQKSPIIQAAEDTFFAAGMVFSSSKSFSCWRFPRRGGLLEELVFLLMALIH